MAKRMLIDATHPEETRVAVVDGRRLEEFDVEVASKKLLKGNIYLAKITRVEPSLQAAFVEYGGNRHGFLAFSEIHPDYYRIPVEDRQALLAEQAALAREQDEEAEDEEDAPPSRRSRGERARSSRAEAPVAAETDAPSEDGDSDEPMSGPEPEPQATAPQESLPEESLPEEPESQETLPREMPADEVGTAAGEVIPLRVTGEGQNRLSGDLFGEGEGETGSRAESVSDVDAASHEGHGEAPAEPGATLADEAPVHVPVIEEAPTQVQPVDIIGGDEAEEPAQRRPRTISRRYKIQDVIKRRQILLVQVTKEERGNKGAALTTYLSLAGRYCVLMPNTDRGGGVSRKITNTGDRKRLKSIIDDLELPAGMAVIVRTAGSERSKPEVKRDFEYLLRLWDEIRALTLRSTSPALIYEEANLIKRAIRDLYTRDIEDIQVEGEEAYRAAKSFMRMLMPSHAKRVQQYKDPTMPLFTRYQIESQLDAIHNPVVQLRSGGYIVINQTEALVAIDVNSGRATRERNIEETALKTNLEASDEIARQLRLRDLAGLIVIDFIDMDEARHNAQVERRLKEAMRNDRARIQLGRISPFGLLELSRQRLRPSLFEASTEVCRFCRGTGHVRSTESTALHVLRSIEEEGSRQKSAAITVSVPAQVALFILNHKRQSLAELEGRQGFRIYLAGDETLVPPEFRIERLKALAPGDAPPAPVIQPSAPSEEVEVEEVAVPDDAEESIEERGEAETPDESPREDRASAGREREGAPREARSGEPGGERRRGRRRRRRGRDRDRPGEATRDMSREAPREAPREMPREAPRAAPIIASSPAGTAIELGLSPGEVWDAGEADDDAIGEGPQLPEAGGVSSPESETGDPSRRRRRRGRRGGRRRRRGGERGTGEQGMQQGGEAADAMTTSAEPSFGPAHDAESAFEATEEPTAQSEFTPEIEPREVPAFSPPAREEERVRPEPRPAPAASSAYEPRNPQPEPTVSRPEPAVQPAEAADEDAAKSGPRKRGWWQRVLS